MLLHRLYNPQEVCKLICILFSILYFKKKDILRGFKASRGLLLSEEQSCSLNTNVSVQFFPCLGTCTQWMSKHAKWEPNWHQARMQMHWSETLPISLHVLPDFQKRDGSLCDNLLAQFGEPPRTQRRSPIDITSVTTSLLVIFLTSLLSKWVAWLGSESGTRELILSYS